MGRLGLNVEKRTAFRGGVQPFGNTYYYEVSFPIGDNSLTNELLDFIVATEKTIHSNQVNFTTGRVWTAGGSRAENNMVIQKTLTGTGAQTDQNGLDRERAILLKFPAGLDVRGRPVFLKKWFHVCGFINGVAIAASDLSQTTQLATSQRNVLDAKALALQNISLTGGNTAHLVSEKGRNTNANGFCYKWLEHHQLGDQWRNL